MRIVDAHHHLWDPDVNYHPWLCDEPMIPFRYGDYSAIRGRFMLDEYDAASNGWNVVASVTMEGEWDPSDPTGEAIWMQRVHDEFGRPAAHVAQAWLDHEDLGEVLKVYRSLPIVRSVRHKPRASAMPGDGAGGMAEPSFLKGFQQLADHGLAFDLQTPWWHLGEAVEMSALSPETKIVLNHAGLPADRSVDGLAGWRMAMTEFAALPQAYVKISGIGLPRNPWSVEDNRDIVRFCIDTFGPHRAMFASNFPVDGLCGSFETIFSAFAELTREDPEEHRVALFRTTAERVYGLSLADPKSETTGNKPPES